MKLLFKLRVETVKDTHGRTQYFAHIELPDGEWLTAFDWDLGGCLTHATRMWEEHTTK